VTGLKILPFPVVSAAMEEAAAAVLLPLLSLMEMRLSMTEGGWMALMLEHKELAKLSCGSRDVTNADDVTANSCTLSATLLASNSSTLDSVSVASNKLVAAVPQVDSPKVPFAGRQSPAAAAAAAAAGASTEEFGGWVTLGLSSVHMSLTAIGCCCCCNATCNGSVIAAAPETTAVDVGRGSCRSAPLSSSGSCSCCCSACPCSSSSSSSSCFVAGMSLSSAILTPGMTFEFLGLLDFLLLALIAAPVFFLRLTTFFKSEFEFSRAFGMPELTQLANKSSSSSSLLVVVVVLWLLLFPLPPPPEAAAVTAAAAS